MQKYPYFQLEILIILVLVLVYVFLFNKYVHHLLHKKIKRIILRNFKDIGNIQDVESVFYSENESALHDIISRSSFKFSAEKNLLEKITRFLSDSLEETHISSFAMKERKKFNCRVLGVEYKKNKFIITIKREKNTYTIKIERFNQRIFISLEDLFAT